MSEVETRAGGEERLGRAVVTELLRLVGHIGRRQVMEMSYQHNMNVNTVYNQSHDKEENIVLTMERMLDRWYEFTICSLSTSEAQSKLLDILRESHCSKFVVEEIRKLCQAGRGDSLDEWFNVEATSDCSWRPFFLRKAADIFDEVR